MTSRTERTGFTLTEVLLVAALIGFLVAVATPVFLRSLHGQRLRQAARTLMQAGRYARTMAILTGRPMSLSIAPGRAEIALQELSRPRAAPLEAIYTREQVLAASEPSLSFSTTPPEEEESPSADRYPPSPPTSRTLTRLLEGIRILSVSVGDDESNDRETKLALVYQPNGTCRPYSVVLENEEGRQAIIKVDFVGEALCEFP